MTTEVYEMKSAASAVSTKEKSVVDEVEPALSSTLSEAGSTEMKKLLEAMASVSCIYDVVFRNLAENNEL